MKQVPKKLDIDDKGCDPQGMDEAVLGEPCDCLAYLLGSFQVAAYGRGI
jgi:hypothetical protein